MGRGRGGQERGEKVSQKPMNALKRITTALPFPLPLPWTARAAEEVPMKALNGPIRQRSGP